MEQAQVTEQMKALLEQHRARCTPPTFEQLAQELGVAPKTIYLWRKGEKIGKLSRILLRLMRDDKQVA